MSIGGDSWSPIIFIHFVWAFHVLFQVGLVHIKGGDAAGTLLNILQVLFKSHLASMMGLAPS